MRWLLLAFLAAFLAVPTATVRADADTYTLRQRIVIEMIYQACDRYGVDEQGCATPLFVAWRETRYGQDVYSHVDVYNGVSTSVGVFQWYAGPRGDCGLYRGAACSGPYYQQYGLAWRENLWLDVDRGVDMLTSYERGGPDYRGHWRAYAIGGYGWPGLPERAP